VSLSRLTKRCQQTAGRLQEHKPHRKVVQRWLHVGGVGCSSVWPPAGFAALALVPKDVGGSISLQ
jgi:hypothetical protein